MDMKRDERSNIDFSEWEWGIEGGEDGVLQPLLEAELITSLEDTARTWSSEILAGFLGHKLFSQRIGQILVEALENTFKDTPPSLSLEDFVWEEKEDGTFGDPLLLQLALPLNADGESTTWQISFREIALDALDDIWQGCDSASLDGTVKARLLSQSLRDLAAVLDDQWEAKEALELSGKDT